MKTLLQSPTAENSLLSLYLPPHIAMSGSNSKRRVPPATASNPSKRFQPSNAVSNGNGEIPNPMEDKMMDEDLFLEETLIKYEEDEEALILL